MPSAQCSVLFIFNSEYLFYYRSRKNSVITKSFQRSQRVRTASQEPIQTVQVYKSRLSPYLGPNVLLLSFMVDTNYLLW